MTGTNDDADDGINRRKVLNQLGAGTFAATFGISAISSTASADDSDAYPKGFELTELDGADAQQAVASFARTREFSRLREGARELGFELDRSSSVVYQSKYEDNKRTMVSISARSGGSFRLVIGRDETTGEIVMGTLESKQFSEKTATITYYELPSLARKSELSTQRDDDTGEPKADGGLVRRSVEMKMGNDGHVTTILDLSEDVSTEESLYCWACRLLAALVCDVGCAAGTAFICGLAGTVVNVIGISACIFITGRICYVISFAGCFLNADEICCRAGDWCC